MKEIIIVVLQSGASSIKSKWNARVYLKITLNLVIFPLRSFPAIFMIVSKLVANKSEQLVMLVSVWLKFRIVKIISANKKNMQIYYEMQQVKIYQEYG